METFFPDQLRSKFCIFCSSNMYLFSEIEAQSDEESTTEYEEDSEQEQAESDVGLEFLLKPEASGETIENIKVG